MTGFEPQDRKGREVLRVAVENTLLLLAPFTPHITEELWEAIGNEPFISGKEWPAWDEGLAKDEEIELVIQVNGKMRGKLMIPIGLSEDEIKKLALGDRKTAEFVGQKDIRKVIVVQGRLVNVVAG